MSEETAHVFQPEAMDSGQRRMACDIAMQKAMNTITEHVERPDLKFELAYAGVRLSRQLKPKICLVYRSDADLYDPGNRYINHFVVFTGFMEYPDLLTWSTMDRGEEGHIKIFSGQDAGISLLTENGQVVDIPDDDGNGEFLLDGIMLTSLEEYIDE